MQLYDLLFARSHVLRQAGLLSDEMWVNFECLKFIVD